MYEPFFRVRNEYTHCFNREIRNKKYPRIIINTARLVLCSCKTDLLMTLLMFPATEGRNSPYGGLRETPGDMDGVDHNEERSHPYRSAEDPCCWCV